MRLQTAAPRPERVEVELGPRASVGYLPRVRKDANRQTTHLHYTFLNLLSSAAVLVDICVHDISLLRIQKCG